MNALQPHSFHYNTEIYLKDMEDRLFWGKYLGENKVIMGNENKYIMKNQNMQIYLK